MAAILPQFPLDLLGTVVRSFPGQVSIFCGKDQIISTVDFAERSKGVWREWTTNSDGLRITWAIREF
jgi:hypothetical protein